MAKVKDKKQIAIYVDAAQYKRFKVAAGKENRSLGNVVLVFAERYLEQSDPETMKALEAAAHALKSYAYGNAAPDLAKEAGAAIEKVVLRLKGGASA